MSQAPLAKKSLGQHWLFDDASLDAMCDGAVVTPGDLVLEIGPGTGSLTQKLLDRGASVDAVELDRDRIGELRQKFAGQDFRLHEISILSYDLTSLAPDYKIVANIPYYLTSNLIRVLSESSNPPSVAVILVQKEVAERVAAKPGAMSLLSVTAQYYWEISLGPVVPAELFTPPPKVDSQIMIMRHRDALLYTGVDTKKFFWLVKAGYSARRKTLLNSLSAGMQLPKDEVSRLLESAGLATGARPQELSLDQWHDLYVAWQSPGV